MQLDLYQSNTGMATIIVDDASQRINQPSNRNWICKDYYCENREECLKDHSLVIQESYRLGSTFIHLCHQNLVIWGLPLVVNDQLVGGVISGFVLFDQNLPQFEEYKQTFPLLDSQKHFVSSRDVNSFSSLLFDAFQSNGLINPELFKLSEERARIQREIGEKLIENKQQDGMDRFLVYQKQEKLMDSIRFCDADEIRDNLNDVLSEIFLEGVANLQLLKFRMLELFVLISRTMVEVGGDIEDFYDLTNQYTRHTDNLDDIYSFSLWLKGVLNDFIERVIAARKKLGQVNRAIEYIKDNLDKKLTVAAVASAVAMSESRFSQLFRQETGSSFPDYVNAAKVEKAKQMMGKGMYALSDIANCLCFTDQSHFTKTFRKQTGMTPKQYLVKLKNGHENNSN